jgi:hypothetical protein
VYFLETSNFVVDWHLKFEEKIWEKSICMHSVPVHLRRENCHIGMQFLLNPLGRTPISFAIMEEGYLIYNFVVQWKAQFSFKIQRK